MPHDISVVDVSFSILQEAFHRGDMSYLQKKIPTTPYSFSLKDSPNTLQYPLSSYLDFKRLFFSEVVHLAMRSCAKASSTRRINEQARLLIDLVNTNPMYIPQLLYNELYKLNTTLLSITMGGNKHRQVLNSPSSAGTYGSPQPSSTPISRLERSAAVDDYSMTFTQDLLLECFETGISRKRSTWIAIMHRLCHHDAIHLALPFFQLSLNDQKLKFYEFINAEILNRRDYDGFTLGYNVITSEKRSPMLLQLLIQHGLNVSMPIESYDIPHSLLALTPVYPLRTVLDCDEDGAPSLDDDLGHDRATIVNGSFIARGGVLQANVQFRDSSTMAFQDLSSPSSTAQQKSSLQPNTPLKVRLEDSSSPTYNHYHPPVTPVNQAKDGSQQRGSVTIHTTGVAPPTPHTPIKSPPPVIITGDTITSHSGGFPPIATTPTARFNIHRSSSRVYDDLNPQDYSLSHSISISRNSPSRNSISRNSTSLAQQDDEAFPRSESILHAHSLFAHPETGGSSQQTQQSSTTQQSPTSATSLTASRSFHSMKKGGVPLLPGQAPPPPPPPPRRRKSGTPAPPPPIPLTNHTPTPAHPPPIPTLSHSSSSSGTKPLPPPIPLASLAGQPVGGGEPNPTAAAIATHPSTDDAHGHEGGNDHDIQLGTTLSSTSSTHSISRSASSRKLPPPLPAPPTFPSQLTFPHIHPLVIDNELTDEDDDSHSDDLRRTHSRPYSLEIEFHYDGTDDQHPSTLGVSTPSPVNEHSPSNALSRHHRQPSSHSIVTNHHVGPSTHDFNTVSSSSSSSPSPSPSSSGQHPSFTPSHARRPSKIGGKRVNSNTLFHCFFEIHPFTSKHRYFDSQSSSSSGSLSSYVAPHPPSSPAVGSSSKEKERERERELMEQQVVDQQTQNFRRIQPSVEVFEYLLKLYPGHNSMINHEGLTPWLKWFKYRDIISLFHDHVGDNARIIQLFLLNGADPNAVSSGASSRYVRRDLPQHRRSVTSTHLEFPSTPIRRGSYREPIVPPSPRDGHQLSTPVKSSMQMPPPQRLSNKQQGFRHRSSVAILPVFPQLTQPTSSLAAPMSLPEPIIDEEDPADDESPETTPLKEDDSSAAVSASQTTTLSLPPADANQSTTDTTSAAGGDQNGEQPVMQLTPIYKSPPLMQVCVSYGLGSLGAIDQQIVELLVHHKAHVNIKNDECDTPLRIVSKLGHVGCMRTLLEHKAIATCDIHYKITQSPLFYAIQHHVDVHCFSLLITNGAFVNQLPGYLYQQQLELAQATSTTTTAVGGFGSAGIGSALSLPLVPSPLFYAVYYYLQRLKHGSADLSLIAYLLQRGALINERDEDGEHVLMKAVRVRKNHQLVELLLKRGANTTFVNKFKKSVIELCCCEDYKKMVR